MPVNIPRLDYDKMLVKWQRVRDCYGGRDTMLAAGSKYVPNLAGLVDDSGNLSTDKNKSYRERGNFYNAVLRTVGGMNGAIFQQPPKTVKTPKLLEGHLKDITLTGVNFEMFALEAGREIFTVSRYGILVDMPPEPEAPMPVGVAKPRPYIAAYCAESIINWRARRINGDEVLVMVVLKECIEEAVSGDMFTPNIVHQYRALYLGSDMIYHQQLYRENPNKKDDYIAYGPEITPMRRGVPLNYIPFVFINSTGITVDLEEPILKDLADVNIGHWRNSVDHEYGLHLVALPTPWASGLKAATGENDKIQLGPSVVWELELQGQAGMLEFTGEGLKAIESAMEDKKKQMATLGARLLEDGPAANTAETATGVKLRHSGDHATLRTVASVLEQGLTAVLQMMAWWEGGSDFYTEEPVVVELNKDYLNTRASAQEVTAMLTALQAGEISFETWWEFLMSGGWSRKGIDAQTERDTIESEGRDDDSTEDTGDTTEDTPATPPAAPKVKRVIRDENGLITSIEES